MYVRHLSVTDFRSWPAAEVPFEPGASVLVGPNGEGKTNLVEALGYVATLGSHRVATDAPLVREGAARAVSGPRSSTPAVSCWSSWRSTPVGRTGPG